MTKLLGYECSSKRKVYIITSYFKKTRKIPSKQSNTHLKELENTTQQTNKSKKTKTKNNRDAKNLDPFLKFSGLCKLFLPPQDFI